MRSLVAREGMEGQITVDSAGTGAWHLGSAPDARARAAAAERGIDLSGHARQVQREDFETFDLVLAMDRENERLLRGMAGDEQERSKVRLLREFDPASVEAGDLEVPDPYYGAAGGFEEVLELVQAACEGLLAEIRSGALA
jgi:protein-tyrosine phosphatase